MRPISLLALALVLLVSSGDAQLAEPTNDGELEAGPESVDNDPTVYEWEIVLPAREAEDDWGGVEPTWLANRTNRTVP